MGAPLPGIVGVLLPGMLGVPPPGIVGVLGMGEPLLAGGTSTLPGFGLAAPLGFILSGDMSGLVGIASPAGAG